MILFVARSVTGLYKCCLMMATVANALYRLQHFSIDHRCRMGQD